MKVLVIQNILSSNNVFGINQLIKKLKLSSKQVKAWFCATTESNRIWKLREKPKFDYQVLSDIEIKIKGADLFTYFINPTIIKELSVLNPDRIIVGGWDQFAYQLAISWGWWHQKQVTIWSGSTIYEPSWRRSLSLSLVKALVGMSTDFLAYGSHAKSYLQNLGASANQIQILFNDVNQAYFSSRALKLKPRRAKLLQKYGVKTPNNFIFAGQFIERKGIFDLLRAYQKVSEKIPNWGLILVGYGQLLPEIKKFLQQSDLSKVVLFGGVDQYDLPPFYAMADCLILPSHEEVWGLVANEALASGLWVIVSDRCGCGPDLPKSRVRIFNTGDIKALSRKLLEVANKV